MLSRIWLSGWFSCPGFSVTRLVYYYCRGARESCGSHYCLLSAVYSCAFVIWICAFELRCCPQSPISTNLQQSLLHLRCIPTSLHESLIVSIVSPLRLHCISTVSLPISTSLHCISCPQPLPHATFSPCSNKEFMLIWNSCGALTN